VVHRYFFWDKKPKLRTAPIWAALLSSFLMIFSNPDINGAMKVFEIIVAHFMVGLLLYFCVWIECRNKNKKE
jgi:hypothetical protein